MSKWKFPIKNNLELIETAFSQIEKETGFHIIDKEYNDSKYYEEDEKYTICEFHIKEIKGFRFALWSTYIWNDESKLFDENHIKWMNSLELGYETELIFFCQYERDLDKFKPSRSGFVIGLYRNEYIKEPDPKEEDIEPFNLFDLDRALKYIKKHPIKSAEYAGCQTRYIWEDDRSGFKILRTYIHDWIYHWKYQFKNWKKLQKAIRGSKKYMKKLTQFNYIIKDQGNCVYPRIEVLVRRKDKIDLELYNKDWDIINKFDDKYSSILNVNWLQYDITEEATEEIFKKDRDCRDSFYWHCYKWITRAADQEWEDDEKVIAYSIEKPEDLNEIIKRKDKEFKDDETSSNP